MSRDGWEGILDTDEEIVWQGRPDGKVVLRIGNILTFIFGLFFAGFALVWMLLAATAGGLFWAFGLIHFSVGIGLAFGALFYSAWLRRRTWYTLTNRRAFIAPDRPILGKRLKSYPITDDTVLEFDDARPGTIYFAEEIRRTNNGTSRKSIGFERIADARDVYKLIREQQRAAG